MIFVGMDWSETHQDVALMSEDGEVLAEFRVEDGVEGLSRIHTAIAEHVQDPSEAILGTESARGLVIQACVAAGYSVFEINPFAASRYRDRHQLSGAKSDRADARMLADAVRTDRHNHRQFSGDTDLTEAIKVLARAHQSLIHQRQSQINILRSTLRQYFPGMLKAFPDLASPATRDNADGLMLLSRASTPAQGRSLSVLQIASALRKAGRLRSIHRRAEQIHSVLRAPQLEAPLIVTGAYGQSAQASARVIMEMTQQIDMLGKEVASHFEENPDAEIIRSLPGLGPVLSARALGEFGDAPNRYVNAKARKNYATTSPVTKASGRLRLVICRFGGNRHLNDTCLRWAFSAVQSSPGARRYYEALRARDKSHNQAIRSVANRLVGIMHGCLTHQALYREDLAWPEPQPKAVAA